jgi:N-alpha-acetyltransferase 40
MGYAQSTASNIPGVGKAMLTCFKSNKSGLRFYDKLGFVLDESSPRDRRLRGGKVVTSDYVILSWRGQATGDEGDRAQNGEPR